MQFFKPAENHLFTGDCMPYFHNGKLYLYWLLDEGHHSGLGGLGGHQWALSTSEDLKHWTHYPVALGIDQEWEKSICTGSVIVEKDTLYAFYSTRVKEDGQVREQLSYAISTDGGVTYRKQQPNPFYYAPEECMTWDFRDPKAFKDQDGLFHLFISGYKKKPELSGFGGYLVHLTSRDLKHWQESKPVLTGQTATPECSDYFKWNGWYYLIYSVSSETYYVKSRNPLGPWEYPGTQALREAWANVYKTAEFHNNRRIAVAFIPGKWNNKDNDGEVFGGNILFRELTQGKNGDLYTKFLPEVLPEFQPFNSQQLQRLSDKTILFTNKGFKLDATNGIAILPLSGLPENFRLTATFVPDGNYDETGMFVKATDHEQRGYKVELNANKQLALVQNTLIESVSGLRKPIEIDMIVSGDFIDMNINGKRSIVNRLPEEKGKNLFFFVKNGQMTVKNVKLFSIK